MTALRRAILRVFLLTACLGLGTALAATPQQVGQFFRAVQIDDAGTVREMLGPVINPNDLNPVGGEPALVLAVREGSMRVFDVLVKHPGVNVDATAVNGNTALMMAALKHNRPAVEALLARGAAVNREGWTPLHYAATSGDNELVRLLLQRGAKIDAVSPLKSGAYTPLMVAAREGYDTTALLLIEQGADASLQNAEGLTAAQLAERAGKTHVAAAIAGKAKR